MSPCAWSQARGRQESVDWSAPAVRIVGRVGRVVSMRMRELGPVSTVHDWRGVESGILAESRVSVTR